MTNGMTVDEDNARERRRGSIVAKLHRYTPMEDGDTEESRQAEYLKSPASHTAAKRKNMQTMCGQPRIRRQQRIEAQLDGDNAVNRSGQRANGFMDCRAVSGCTWL